MKKSIVAALILAACTIFANAQSNESSYKTAAGVKFYPGAGITIKHFVKSNPATERIAAF